jgi:hypothetical protein
MSAIKRREGISGTTQTENRYDMKRELGPSEDETLVSEEYFSLVLALKQREDD